jgi:hypothetical protein
MIENDVAANPVEVCENAYEILCRLHEQVTKIITVKKAAKTKIDNLENLEKIATKISVALNEMKPLMDRL